ncbi:MAG: acylphosphatase [Nanoarchaeota archaeon]|nr:acylphosphatase [Nanoarchaeota archaeon]
MVDETDQKSPLQRIRIHLFLEGEVQGVFLRSMIRNKAQLLHVRGWVRNLANNKVEALFEGDRDDVEELVTFCRAGPGAAAIDKSTMEEEPYRGEFSDFEIRTENYLDE